MRVFPLNLTAIFIGIKHHTELLSPWPEEGFTRKRACEQLQKCWDHEQASTRLNFASKWSKGKIFRAVKNLLQAENIRSARYSRVVLSKLLAARKANFFICAGARKKIALLACLRMLANTIRHPFKKCGLRLAKGFWNHTHVPWKSRAVATRTRAVVGVIYYVEHKARWDCKRRRKSRPDPLSSDLRLSRSYTTDT